MRSPSPARRRSPRVAGLAGLMVERRHTGSRRLCACSASLLLACAGALGAHAAELARPSDADLRAATASAASQQAAPLAAATAAASINPIDPTALLGELGQDGVCQRLAEAATTDGDAAAMAGAAVPPVSAAQAAAAGASSSGPAGAADAAPPRPAAAPVPHPALGFDAALGVPRRPFGKLIYQIARTYALNPLLVAAIAKVESDFNPRARSRKGAYGLMQVLPSTARRFGLPRKRDLLNPRKNLETASRYLRWLVDRFGDDPIRVLAAYNAGEGAVDRFGGVPPFSETRDYVQRIFGLLGFSVLLDAPATAPAAAAAAALAGVAGAR